MIGDKLYMRQEHGFERGERRWYPQDSFIQPGHQPFGHPLHHCLLDGSLAGKVSKQGTLGHSHASSNRRSCDTIWVLLCGQLNYGLDSHCTAIICRKIFNMVAHKTSRKDSY
jgi:hypothetical protein